MFFIFGWGHQTIWDVGSTFRIMCNHCNNEEFWGLSRRTTWFTLFFIPIIPYKTEWLVTCPICKYGSELDSAQVEKIKPIAEVNQQLLEGKISEQEHNLKISALNSEAQTVDDNKVTALPEPQEIAQEASVYCGECGKGISSQGNFCTSCGTKANKTI